jgi:hypothetical protein
VPDFYKYTGALTPASTISRKKAQPRFRAGCAFLTTGYAFGRIAEQNGERDVAMAIYKRVTKPKWPDAIPSSSYWLAQNRIKATASEGNGVRAESR